jgi:putative PIN family toxin of toxin-antitoxin system
MIRVVLDTNVLVSALLTQDGTEAAVLSRIIEGKLMWCVSEVVLAEYAAVLKRPKFKNIDPTKIDMALAAAHTGEMSIITGKVTRSPDDADNRFLECAEAARADFLITGNKRHFPQRWKATEIVNAREFLEGFDVINR